MDEAPQGQETRVLVPGLPLPSCSLSRHPPGERSPQPQDEAVSLEDGVGLAGSLESLIPCSPGEATLTLGKGVGGCEGTGRPGEGGGRALWEGGSGRWEWRLVSRAALVTWKILDTSSEFRCCATSHSLAVISIRRQMSMSTFMAFSWIFVSRSVMGCREDSRGYVSKGWSKRGVRALLPGP